MFGASDILPEMVVPFELMAPQERMLMTDKRNNPRVRFFINGKVNQLLF
jgi:hypothetical protein